MNRKQRRRERIAGTRPIIVGPYGEFEFERDNGDRERRDKWK